MEAALIDHYDSFTFNVIDWLATGGMSSSESLKVHYVAYDDIAGMAKVRAARWPLVLSPGPKSPYEAGPTWELLQEKLGTVPILGICLGHQLLACAAGAAVVRRQAPLHGTTRTIEPTSYTGLFASLTGPFEAAVYNSLTVDASHLNEHWRVAARSSDGEVQSLAWEPLANAAPAWGVQFHPESFLSEQAQTLRTNWLAILAAWYQS